MKIEDVKLITDKYNSAKSEGWEFGDGFSDNIKIIYPQHIKKAYGLSDIAGIWCQNDHNVIFGIIDGMNDFLSILDMAKTKE